ncbi:Type IV pilus biogenesis protein PilQ [Richelia intracellularis]|nr:Type IV pilus biogenesis protein PilQ [Richelia intracellularis]
MKQIHGKNTILGAAGLIIFAAQPAWAKTTQITDVKLQPISNGGVNVILKISSDSRPQVFTTRKGRSLVTDIINTQLKLPQGNSFSQQNPSSGIASVTINQLDANSIRLVITGSENALKNQPVKRESNGFTLSFTPGSPIQAGDTNNQNPPVANNPAPSAPPPVVPNPKVTIDGQPATTEGITQPQVPAPPFLPRAVAPPVGDMAISTLDASPINIDLGTQERVPRLVLRDAPVREVLSLLARAAGLNLAYIGNNAANDGKENQAATSGTISLDIENEPVQDVFNYVLRLSGLEANRSGRTIFVGAKLPNGARNLVMRTIRINQAKVGEMVSFLVSMGAESAISKERQIDVTKRIEVGDKIESETTTATENEVQTQSADFEYSQPLLRGLQVIADERTNSITLIGTPRMVDMAMGQMAKLDIRRRQVAVNVKIIDVNLVNKKDISTSFSFGIGNTFFSSNGGLAGINFGTATPATTTTSRSFNISNFPQRFLASVQAQVQSGKAKILTDPTLIVQEGQTAEVNLTQEVIGNIKNEITRGDDISTQTITAEKEEVGLTLAVKIDGIDDNGFVSLSVSPTIASPQAPAEININGGTQRIFLIAKRALRSGLVRLRDGQTLVLSGIIQDHDRVSVSKVPILGDIPLLGSLFRRTNKENSRNEVIVLLTPQIMDDSQRSSYGYNYRPSPDVRQMLERSGLNVPK